MVKNFKHILQVLFLFAFVSCEQIDIIENDLPYIETVVVKAELEGNNVFTGVSFTRTLPHNQVYTIEKAELKDVITYLQVDGKRIIPLAYTKDGIYKSSEDIIIETGKSYELFAKWNGTQIYSKTYVPLEPQAQRASIAGGYLNGSILANKDEVIGTTWIIAYTASSISDEAAEFYELKTAKSDKPENVLIRTTDIPIKYQPYQYHSRYYMRFYSFDKQFLEYFKTKNGNEPIENVFAQGASTVVWNVHGNNVIGLFIGFTKSKIIKAE
ncbi:MAG: hypothetical protein NTX22_15575 [Ignavibacteriales bacterium]|nr:hypothetical protein [Ignavibacteriales bacterium]